MATGTGCVSCRLHKKCEHPRTKARGRGVHKILIIGEAPGREDEEYALRSTISRLGYPLDDCRTFNAVNCSTPDNREPTVKEIECCRNSVWEEIKQSKIVKPNVVLLLGMSALKSVIGQRWHKNLGTLSRWRGLAIPDVWAGAWIVPTFGVSDILKNPDDRGLQKIWEMDIEKAFSLVETKLPVGAGVLPAKIGRAHV